MKKVVVECSKLVWRNETRTWEKEVLVFMLSWCRPFEAIHSQGRSFRFTLFVIIRSWNPKRGKILSQAVNASVWTVNHNN